MRYLALLAALALLPTGAFALSTSGHQRAAAPLGERAILSMASPLHLHPWLSTRRTTLQTGATAVPTGTATPLPSTTPVATATPGTTTTPVPTTTPVATGTATTYPDPVTLLRKMVLVYEQVRSDHFVLVTNLNQPNTEKLHLTATGEATCKGPSLRGHVSAKDTKEATSKVSTLSVSFIIINKTAYQKSKSTKGLWKKISPAAFSQLGIAADNVLLCPSSQSGSGGSGTSQFKNLVNLGPGTFRGRPVWRIQAEEIGTGSNGQQSQGTFGLLVDQTRYLPYVQTYSGTDQNVKISQKETLTKFGEKLNIKAPKIAKPKAKHSTKKSSSKKTKHKKKP